MRSLHRKNAHKKSPYHRCYYFSIGKNESQAEKNRIDRVSIKIIYCLGKDVSALRIMAIDYGDARTGVAVSDPTGFLAGYADVIHSRSPDKVALEIARLAREHQVEELVLGLPRNMDGTEGPRAELCRAFALRLEAVSGIKPVLWDERRTTIEAHGILHSGGKKMKKHKKTVDAVAATLILEGYLARKKL